LAKLEEEKLSAPPKDENEIKAEEFVKLQEQSFQKETKK